MVYPLETQYRTTTTTTIPAAASAIHSSDQKQAKILSGHQTDSYELLKSLDDIDNWIVNGTKPACSAHINQLLARYQLTMPVGCTNHDRPLTSCSSSEQTHRIDLLKKIHNLAFAELGFWNEDNTWQTRKPLMKNCAARNILSKHQYKTACKLLTQLGSNLSKSNIDNTIACCDLKTLRAIVLQASVNGLITQPAYSITYASRDQLYRAIHTLVKFTKQYQQVNSTTPKNAYALQRTRSALFSTRTNQHAGAIKEFSKFLSEVKNIPPKALLRADNKGTNLSLSKQDTGLSGLGIIAGAVGVIEASAGFIENIKKFRLHKKQNCFDRHIKTYYQDSCYMYALAKNTSNQPQQSFDYYYAKNRMTKSSHTLFKRTHSRSTKFEIYGNLLRYPLSATRDVMATVIFGMGMTTGIVAPGLAQAASVIAAPTAFLAFGLSGMQAIKSTKRVKEIKKFQHNLDVSFSILRQKKTTSPQTLATLKELINNARYGEPRSTKLKFYKDTFSSFVYANSAAIATWSAIGAVASGVSGPPGWLIVGSLAAAAVSGAVGYTIYYKINKIRKSPAKALESAEKIRVIADFVKNRPLNKQDIKVLQKHKYTLRKLGINKKTFKKMDTAAFTREFSSKVTSETIDAFASTFNASKNLIKIIDMVKGKNFSPDTHNYLKQIGVSDILIKQIQTAPLTVMNIRRQIELLANMLKVKEYTDLSTCVAYVESYSKTQHA